MLGRDLQEIGLNEKEAKVYLATLELGQSAVQDIARQSGVNRATTYFIIEALMKMGLMSSFHKGKKQYFVAADPDNLVNILEEEKQSIKKRENSLKKLLPQLQSINSKQRNKRPVVRYYENKDGIEAMQSEFCRDNNAVVYTAFSEDSAKTMWTKEEQVAYAEKLDKNKTARIGVYTYEKEGGPKVSLGDDLIKLPKDKYNFASGVSVYKNKVSLTTYKSNLGAILIESEDIAKTIKTLITLAIEAAKGKK